MRKRRNKIEQAEFEADVIALRQAGLAFDQISTRLGAPVSTVHDAFSRALKAVPRNSAQDMLALHNMRLERLFRLINKEAERGSLAAVRVALEVLKQIAVLNGLNAPARIETTGRNGGPIQTEADSELRDAIMELTQEERDDYRALLIKIDARHQREEREGTRQRVN